MLFKIFVVVFALVMTSVSSFLILSKSSADNSGCNSHDIKMPGFLTSPRYPHNYLVSTSCVYSLHAPAERRVYVNFGEIETEDCCDYVEVFDGSDTKARRIDRFSGSYLAHQKKYVSSGPSLTIRFYSDMTITYTGFFANVTYH